MPQPLVDAPAFARHLGVARSLERSASPPSSIRTQRFQHNDASSPGRDGRSEARTQGVPCFSALGRPRTPPRGEQRGPAAQGSLCWSLLRAVFVRRAPAGSRAFRRVAARTRDRHASPAPAPSRPRRRSRARRAARSATRERRAPRGSARRRGRARRGSRARPPQPCSRRGGSCCSLSAARAADLTEEAKFPQRG